VSGVIILLDKSIKPGDVIEIDDAYGSINSLRTRYVSVITRDRKEYLIPNEDFITSPVINWSFTGKEIRIRADVGVAYGTDLRKAIALCVEAAEAEERVLEKPESKCLLLGFGDSSIDLQLRFWINDAHNGVSNIKSAVLLGVWDRFEEAGIEIPFPQVDLNVKSDFRKQS
jgi:small-conductance mechanosensitive channel